MVKSTLVYDLAEGWSFTREDGLEGAAAPSFSVIGNFGVGGAVDDWICALENLWDSYCGNGCWCFCGGTAVSGWGV